MECANGTSHSYATVRVHKDDLRQLKQENVYIWNCLMDILNANAYSLLRCVIGIYTHYGARVPDIDTLCLHGGNNTINTNNNHPGLWSVYSPCTSVSDYFLTQVLYNAELITTPTTPPTHTMSVCPSSIACADSPPLSQSFVKDADSSSFPLWLHGCITSISTFAYVLSVVGHRMLMKTTATRPLLSSSVALSNSRQTPQSNVVQFIQQWAQLLQFTFPSLTLLLCEQSCHLVPLIITSLNQAHVRKLFVTHIEHTIKECAEWVDDSSTHSKSSTSSWDSKYLLNWEDGIDDNTTLVQMENYLSHLADLIYPVDWITQTFQTIGFVKLTVRLNEWHQEYAPEHKRSIDLRQPNYHHPKYSYLLQPNTQQYFQALILASSLSINDDNLLSDNFSVPKSSSSSSQSSLLFQKEIRERTTNMSFMPQGDAPALSIVDDMNRNECCRQKDQEQSTTTSFISTDQIVNTLSQWRSQYNELGRRINMLTRHLLSSLQQTQQSCLLDSSYSVIPVPPHNHQQSLSTTPHTSAVIGNTISEKQGHTNTTINSTKDVTKNDMNANEKQIGNCNSIMVSITDSVDLLNRTARSIDNVQNNNDKIDNVRQVLECPICMDRFVVGCLTPCGHLYCEECGRRVIQQFHRCSQCQQVATQFVRIYFPGGNPDDIVT